MNALLFWGTTVFFLILLFILLKYFIRKYFNSKKGHYDATKSNYISAVAITTLFSGFVILNPKTIIFFLNFSIIRLNQGFNLEIENFERSITILDILIYSILCISIIFIIYLSYRHRSEELQLYFDQNREANKENRKIIFPDHEFTESPFLHDRIKELFELKYKRFQLELKETKLQSEDKVLYGSYEDDFNTIYEIIYCDVSSSKLIPAKHVVHIFDFLNLEIFKKISKNVETSVAHFYYITESADFEPSNYPPQIKLYTENQFLSSIIDFRRYLIKLQHNFENEKLFSAIHSEDQKKTLAETFIEPSYYIGDKRDKRNNKLFQYVMKWLEESGNQKHLVLLGDYGMGKTSFIKYFASKLASSDIASANCTRFPVYISLTNCSPIHGGIYKTIKSFVAENLGVDFDLFKKLIDRGKILFLLDSFDEMGFIGTKEQRFKQFNEIWQLATKNNKIIITGRPSYFPTEFELKQILSIPHEGHEVVQTQPFAERLTLCKLDENQIISYIGKYYHEMARTYYRWIKSNNGLLELCKRPSMMHIIREMLESLYEAKSDTKLSAGVVMKKYVEYWINRQQSKRIQSAFHGNDQKKLEFIQTFFSELAVEFYLTEKMKMRADEILLRVNKQITIWKIPNFEKAENLEGFQQEILTGYFIEREDDDYRFVHKSFFEFFIASRIIELLKVGNFKDKLMYKTWSLEVIDFVYDTIPERHQKVEGVPALLSLSNSNILAKLKLIHFNLDIEFNRLFLFILKYIIPIYVFIFPVYFYVNYFLIKKHEKNVDQISQIISVEIFWVILVMLLAIIVNIFIFRKLNKIKLFTIKSVILSISKSEINSSKFVRKIFGISELTIKISDIVINKIYTTIYRRFENSVFDNVTFTNCDFQRTMIYDSYLKNVNFSNSKFHRMTFINCQMDNVDFSQANKIRYNKFSILFSGSFIGGIRFLKQKRDYNYILNFVEMTPSHIDKRTLDSLKAFIIKNNLELNEDFIAEDWLINILQ